MGSKTSIPPPPDMSGLYAALNMQSQAAAEQARVANSILQQQLDLARQQYADNKGVTEQVINAALEQQDLLNKQSAADRARYEELFQPLEAQLVAKAASPQAYEDAIDPSAAEAEVRKRITDHAAQNASIYGTQAAVNVTQQFDIARQAAQDQLESYGLDPGQVRGGALDIEGRLAEAAGRAGAFNQTALALTQQGQTEAEQRGTEERRFQEARNLEARRYVDALNNNNLMQAINLGRGYPGQALAQTQTALGAGTGAVQSGFGLAGSGATTMGTGLQWGSLAGSDTSGAISGLSAQGSLQNQSYNELLKAIELKDKQSSGIGALAGALGGAALGNPAIYKFAAGGVIPESQGVPIPPSASPSGGAITDDIPARLNAGEFVVPADVVRWKGEEFFQKTIAKSREDKPAAPAQPRMAVPVGNPSALPVQVNPPRGNTMAIEPFQTIDRPPEDELAAEMRYRQMIAAQADPAHNTYYQRGIDAIGGGSRGPLRGGMGALPLEVRP